MRVNGTGSPVRWSSAASLVARIDADDVTVPGEPSQLQSRYAWNGAIDQCVKVINRRLGRDWDGVAIIVEMESLKWTT